MVEPRNLGNALIIVAGMYFLIGIEMGLLAKIGVMGLIVFAFATWGFRKNDSEGQEKLLLNAKILSEKERALNYRAGSRQLVVQTSLLSRGLKP